MTIKAFHKIESGADHTSGKNLLFIQTAVRIIAKFLQEEQKDVFAGVKIKLLHTEEQFNCDIKLSQQTVKLRGTIDRMDQWNNKIRIIDYKTGAVDPSKLKVKSMTDVFELPEYDKAFQLLFYTLLFQKNFPNINQEVEAGILSLRKISDGLYTIAVNDDFDTIMQSFEQNLLGLMEQMFDTKSSFKQTDNIEICNYCAFANICMK
jgi:ATP-dependent helicase/DNAse subunit B